jgi:hypothetical protein
METANFASGKLWSVSKPKIKKKGPDTGPFGYFLDFVIFFFGAILVGVSTAVPVQSSPAGRPRRRSILAAERRGLRRIARMRSTSRS